MIKISNDQVNLKNVLGTMLGPRPVDKTQINLSAIGNLTADKIRQKRIGGSNNRCSENGKRLGVGGEILE